MIKKIEEMFFLYNKENQLEENKIGQLSTRRLTLEEILKNRKEAIKTLMDMPKSELVDYILGIDKFKHFL